LGRLYDTLEPRDQDLIKNSLFVGLLMDSFIEKPKLGDFLIRTIVGADQEQGLLAVGAPLRVGQTIQFHVRDADTSKLDLKTVLSNYLSKHRPKEPGKFSGATGTAGALLFSCLGRGSTLYGIPDHDAKMVGSAMGNVPLAGFFCNGEIGPVSGKTYLHGYTSSIAIFTEKPPVDKTQTALLESLSNS
jgi:small ligand-binding sensory domain FIST